MTPTRSMFDLSHNNPLPTSTYAGDISLFEQAKGAGWVAMMHKLTQGLAFVDPVALGRIGAANTAGLLLGGYHYMDTTPVAGRQFHARRRSREGDLGEFRTLPRFRAGLCE